MVGQRHVRDTEKAPPSRRRLAACRRFRRVWSGYGLAIIFAVAPCAPHSEHRGPPCVRLAEQCYERPGLATSASRFPWQTATIGPVSVRRRSGGFNSTNIGRHNKRLFEARDTRGMQLRIIDRSALLFDTTGTVTAVRIHHCPIPLAVTHVLPRRPRARTVLWLSLRTTRYHLGPVCVRFGAGCRDRSDGRQKCGREGQARHRLVLRLDFVSLIKVTVGDFSRPPLKKISNMPKSISARLGIYSDQGARAPPTRRQNRTIFVIDRTVLRPLATIASRVLRLALALLALFEPAAIAVHFQDVDVAGLAGRAARRSASRIRTRRSTRRTAVLGTTITPYCFFWQASQEAEDERVGPAAHTLLAAPEEAPVEIGRMRFDIYIGMGYSNVISLFVIVSTAATLKRERHLPTSKLHPGRRDAAADRGGFHFRAVRCGNHRHPPSRGAGTCRPAPRCSARRSAGPPASTVSRSMPKRCMAPSRCPP
jgi:hypothetical protein